MSVTNYPDSVEPPINATDIANGSVTNTEFQYLDGVTSAIQTQLNAKAPSTAINAANIADGSISNAQFQLIQYRRTLQYILTSVNVNSLNTDVGTFSGLPAKYIIRRLTAFDASTGLTLAAIDLRTAPGGGGTTLVNGFVLSALTGATSYVDCTLATAAATTYQAAASLFVRNTIAQGGAATITLELEIEVCV